MEIIKKKICLENFISRIPALVETIETGKEVSNLKDGSWGKVPNSIIVLGKNMKYGTLMDLYYSLLKVVMYSVYYEYDLSGKKWLKYKGDWRIAFDDYINVIYANKLPTSNISDKTIVGLTTIEGEYMFYNKVKELTGGSYNGFNVINEINNIIGRRLVPYKFVCQDCGEEHMGSRIEKCKKCNSSKIIITQESRVPHFIYLVDVPDIISFMEELKQNANTSCCEIKRYKEHGGDTFLNYLIDLKEKGWEVYKNILGTKPTIDIPILLTTKMLDLGQYRTYSVDEIFDDGNNDIKNEPTNSNSNLVFTSGESKLKTLRKRKQSVDDYGTELPGIYTNGNNTLELPFVSGYIKNTRVVNDELYGDTIYSIQEKSTAIEQNKSYYESLKSVINSNKVNEGTITNPISGLKISDVKPAIIKYGGIGYSHDRVYNYLNTHSGSIINSLKNDIINIFENNYPKYYGISQDYSLSYQLVYGEDNEEIVKNETINGTIYIVFNDVEVEITYVLGGKLNKNTLKLSEINPFELNESDYESWNGSGIWYKESFPLKKLCVGEFLIDNEKKELTYDSIDFKSKEITYKFDGIDFPRKNYILCENICYKSESYKNNATNDVVFKDAKMMGLNYPLKEEYDVVIDRGMSAAFEKHLQLSELKTWQDLEDYRNGMFLNK